MPDLIPNVLVPSLVVAKGNVIEVWDARPDGLVEVAKTEVWGMVVGLEWVVRPVSERRLCDEQTRSYIARLLLGPTAAHRRAHGSPVVTSAHVPIP